ncbi:MAG: enoyl-CoA hydratase/isomerase family protein [Thermodesulfobacteriota bacterium]
MNTGNVSVEKSGPVAVVRLDKPPVNAIDLELLADAEAALTAVEADPDIRAVVVTGTGQSFCGGLNLKKVPFYHADQQRRMVEDLNRIITRLYGFPRPLITAMNGHAIAGGLILALVGDYRIGPVGPYLFGFTEVRAGIPFPYCTLELLKAELPQGTARRLMLVGRNLDSEEALTGGVLDELQPAGQVLARALELARDLAGLPAEAYGRIKRQAKGEALARMEEAVRTNSDPLLQCWLTGESRTSAPELLLQARRG